MAFIRRSFATLRDTIGQTLAAALEPKHLDVVDESKMHSRGTETHFKITVVSDKFESLSQVQRQRLVYKTLNECWQGTLHSLTLTTKTLDEWNSDPTTHKPPRCVSSN
mmetsp:Transcript_7751/g.14717  ORF Transcript_7751/g.14717 Transcript_7751/m.14717 type:complete len:108 (+) Transcript_7751:12-335(+)